MVSPSRSPSLVPSCSIANVQDLREVLDAPHPHRKLLEVDKASVPFVVDLLYTELQRPALDDAYRKRCIKCLKAMGNRFRALPSSLSMKDIRRKGKHPLTGGGFADIYKGTAGDITVCLKVLRVHLAESTKKKKQIIGGFCGEALIWTQLRHPNILPLLGINTELFPSGFCLVSPWMMNGNIVSFLKENPSHDKLQSICEIIAGLEYLHLLSPPIAHGDIKGVSFYHFCWLYRLESKLDIRRQIS
ncbi:hypothetical protein L218DRAFT_874405 [Marasmius fiardii PR-910]|nr:hypothetical protein L218DRAFT_874405 [Marasmius fiardii PR-910]